MNKGSVFTNKLVADDLVNVVKKVLSPSSPQQPTQQKEPEQPTQDATK